MATLWISHPIYNNLNIYHMKKLLFLVPLVGLIYMGLFPEQIRYEDKLFKEIVVIIQTGTVMTLFFIGIAIFILLTL